MDFDIDYTIKEDFFLPFLLPLSLFWFTYLFFKSGQRNRQGYNFGTNLCSGICLHCVFGANMGWWHYPLSGPPQSTLCFLLCFGHCNLVKISVSPCPAPPGTSLSFAVSRGRAKPPGDFDKSPARAGIAVIQLSAPLLLCCSTSCLREAEFLVLHPRMQGGTTLPVFSNAGIFKNQKSVMIYYSEETDPKLPWGQTTGTLIFFFFCIFMESKIWLNGAAATTVLSHLKVPGQVGSPNTSAIQGSMLFQKHVSST